MDRNIIVKDHNVLQSTILDLSKQFGKNVYEVKSLLAKIIEFNMDRPAIHQVEFEINIDRECIIIANGGRVATRNGRPATELSGKSDKKYYYNSIAVYTNEGKYTHAFLDSELLYSTIFVSKSEISSNPIKGQTLTMTCFTVDSDDAKKINKYFRATEDKATNNDLPVPDNQGKAIIETSEGG